ncbi:PPE family protein [Mycobacterium lacus]|uniref:PPE domain-containing protein n=1 Tax=Mycobacterium lacus TaxID=169765 RepID=A0A1X1YBE2_9MYCO|nr:PPE family protein [Mycobacterium lacus]ORW08366.1 hypothetical protein AWC15_18905 [Mycobacterium lacus]BBX97978.1 hypothetical protein MLAC_32720 [Mycobacterium lacus]
MNFPVLPAEITSALMFAGPGSAPMLATAAAWDGLAGGLASATGSFGSVIWGLAEQAWQGPASAAMTAAATSYAGGCGTPRLMPRTHRLRPRRSPLRLRRRNWATIHPMAVAANRSGFVKLVLSNLFGQNAPAIAAAEFEYEQIWAQDVVAMSGYHAAAAAVAEQLTPLQSLVPGFNIGFGNTGTGNFGSANTGDYNAGSGNFGSWNLGSGNGNSGSGTPSITASFYVGNGNLGSWNLGSGNFGNSNVGHGNVGSTNYGSGNTGNDNRRLQLWCPQHWFRRFGEPIRRQLGLRQLRCRLERGLGKLG